MGSHVEDGLYAAFVLVLVLDTPRLLVVKRRFTLPPLADTSPGACAAP
jgi:hypothetical protein